MDDERRPPPMLRPPDAEHNTSSEKNFNLILASIKSHPRGNEALQNKKIVILLKTLAGETQGIALDSGPVQQRAKIGYQLHLEKLQEKLLRKFDIDISEHV